MTRATTSWVGEGKAPMAIRAQDPGQATLWEQRPRAQGATRYRAAAEQEALRALFVSWPLSERTIDNEPRTVTLLAGGNLCRGH